MPTARQLYNGEVPLPVNLLTGLPDQQYWQSGFIDNSNIQAFWVDVLLRISTTTVQASEFGNVGFFLASSTNNTIFPGGASGVQGPYTPTAQEQKHLKVIDAMPIDASENVARIFTKRYPIRDLGAYFSFVILNLTGADLGNQNSILYRLVQSQSD